MKKLVLGARVLAVGVAANAALLGAGAGAGFAAGDTAGAAGVAFANSAVSSASDSSWLADLRVFFWEIDGDSEDRTLRCRHTADGQDEGEGYFSPQRACDQLRALAAEGKDPFAPVPQGRFCSHDHSSSDVRALVHGTWRGKAVDTKFHQDTDCEHDRWNAITTVLYGAG